MPQYQSALSAKIKPLINDLNFIKNKTNWGYSFRFGAFEIFEIDFNLIANAMERRLS